MHLEIKIALEFFVSHLYTKLPRLRIDDFQKNLDNSLNRKYHNHWHINQPQKGSAFRCLEPTDDICKEAAALAYLSDSEILKHLPSNLMIWIDPGEVSFCIHEEGEVLKHDSIAHIQIHEIYSSRKNNIILCQPACPSQYMSTADFANTAFGSKKRKRKNLK